MKKYLTTIQILFFFIAFACETHGSIDKQKDDDKELKELNLLGEKLIQAIKEENIEKFLSCFFSNEELEYLYYNEFEFSIYDYNKYREGIKVKFEHLLKSFDYFKIDKKQITYHWIRTQSSRSHYPTSTGELGDIYVYFLYNDKIYEIEAKSCKRINGNWKFFAYPILRGEIEYIKKQKSKFNGRELTWDELLLMETDQRFPFYLMDKNGKMYIELTLVITKEDSLPFTGTSLKKLKNSEIVEEFWAEGKWTGFRKGNKVYKIESKIAEFPKSISGKWELQMRGLLNWDESMEKESKYHYGSCDYFGLEILENNRLKSYQFSKIQDSILWEVWDDAGYTYSPEYDFFIFDNDPPFRFLQKQNGEIRNYGGSGVIFIHPSLMEAWEMPYNCILANPEELCLRLKDYVFVFKKVKEFKFNLKFASFETEYQKAKEDAHRISKVAKIEIDSIKEAQNRVNNDVSLSPKQKQLNSSKLFASMRKIEDKRDGYRNFLKPQRISPHKAEAAKSDSVNLAFYNAKNDTVKINILITYAKAISTEKDKENANYLAGKALDFSIKIKYQQGIDIASEIINQIVENLFNNADSIIKQNNIFNPASSMASNFNRIAMLYKNIGDIYKFRGIQSQAEKEYFKAFECYSRAVKIYSERNNKSGTAIQLGLIGYFYFEIGEYNKSLDYFYKAININNELGVKSNNRACFKNIGDVYTKQGELIKAKEYYKKAEQIENDTRRK